MPAPINELINTWLHPLGWSTVITSCLTVGWFIVKRAIRLNTLMTKAEIEWDELVERQKVQSDQMNVAMTNHWPHIEANTERMAVAGERTAEAIQQQAVTLATIKTILETQNRYEH